MTDSAYAGATPLTSEEFNALPEGAEFVAVEEGSRRVISTWVVLPSGNVRTTRSDAGLGVHRSNLLAAVLQGGIFRTIEQGGGEEPRPEADRPLQVGDYVRVDDNPSVRGDGTGYVNSPYYGALGRILDLNGYAPGVHRVELVDNPTGARPNVIHESCLTRCNEDGSPLSSVPAGEAARSALASWMAEHLSGAMTAEMVPLLEAVGVEVGPVPVRVSLRCSGTAVHALRNDEALGAVGLGGRSRIVRSKAMSRSHVIEWDQRVVADAVTLMIPAVAGECPCSTVTLEQAARAFSESTGIMLGGPHQVTVTSFVATCRHGRYSSVEGSTVQEPSEPDLGDF